jgi:hypothetical protein
LWRRTDFKKCNLNWPDSTVGPFLFWFASVPTPQSVASMLALMAPSKQPNSPDKTLDELLDRVSIAREELVAIERTLERLRSDIAKAQKPKADLDKAR